MSISAFTIHNQASIGQALRKIDGNNKGFLIVLDGQDKVVGTITDGDIRRAILDGSDIFAAIPLRSGFQYLKHTDNFSRTCELFKSGKIDFLPICNQQMQLINLITKKQFHVLLLHDERWKLTDDFSSIDENEIDFEVYNKPWGFYKSTVLSEHFQSKIITVFPGEELSLQEHKEREEHWIIIKGKGIVVLGESESRAFPGKHIHIPRGSKHQIINNGHENIVFAEVQLGSYFGEDDIIRHFDKYNRDKYR